MIDPKIYKSIDVEISEMRKRGAISEIGANILQENYNRWAATVAEVENSCGHSVINEDVTRRRNFYIWKLAEKRMLDRLRNSLRIITIGNGGKIGAVLKTITRNMMIVIGVSRFSSFVIAPWEEAR